MRKKTKKNFYTVLAILIIILVFYKLSANLSPQVLSPIPDDLKSTTPAISANPQKPAKSPNELKIMIQNLIGNRWDNYSVYVKQINGNFEMGINETTIYMAASVNKIPILAALYHLHKIGEVDLDKKITLQAKDIQDYGTGSIRYDEPGSVYSVKTLAKLMIEKSDNTAAYILANYIIGLNKNQTLTDSWGLAQTDMYKNKTSNKDMALIMEKIYTRQIAGPADTQEMLSFLSNTIYNTRLPAQLPEDVVCYHKIGTEVGHIHDVGIIEFNGQAFFVGVLTADAQEGEETDKLISQLGKIVYEYIR